MPDDEAEFVRRIESRQIHGGIRQFQWENGPSFIFKLLHDRHWILCMLPRDRLLRSQRGLRDFLPRRLPCVARQINLLDGERVARSEERPDDPQGTNIMREEGDSAHGRVRRYY